MSHILFYWLPRVLAALFIAFISMFALDVFQEGGSPAHIATALLVHLLPSIVLLIALVLAWRWEWIGALVFGVAGALMLYFTWGRLLLPLLSGHLPPVLHSSLAARGFNSLILAGPTLLVALLFLVGWFKRSDLRSAKAQSNQTT